MSQGGITSAPVGLYDAPHVLMAAIVAIEQGSGSNDADLVLGDIGRCLTKDMREAIAPASSRISACTTFVV